MPALAKHGEDTSDNVEHIHAGDLKCYVDDASVLLLLSHLSTEPVEALVEAIASCSTAGLNVPRSALQCMQAKFVSDFSSSLSLWKILLVGKDQ